MIDEVCEPWGSSRKHAIKLLGAKVGWEGDPTRSEGRPVDDGDEVVVVLWQLWTAARSKETS